MKGAIQPPRVTVQPNFDVIMESEIYPARLMQTLTALAEEISAPADNLHASVVTLQLKKERIAAALVRDPNLDVVALLRQLNGRDLPPNVVTELEEWSGHAEQFTLYQGFGLLESASLPPQAESYVVERISPAFSLVRQADALVNALEQAGLAPLSVKHGAGKFAPQPETAQSVFPKQSLVPPAPRRPDAIFLKRRTQVALNFSGYPQAFDDFRKVLVEAHCPIQANTTTYTITFSSQYQTQFEEVLRQLADKYQVEILDAA